MFLLLIRNKKSIFAESFTRMKQKILERLGYSNRIERMFGRGMMIALTGQRRVGKSCVMRRIYNHIAENEENHVIYIDKEKTSFDMIANYQDLETYVAANIVEGKDSFPYPQRCWLLHKSPDPDSWLSYQMRFSPYLYR